jgi:translocation protein SEC62
MQATKNIIQLRADPRLV